MNDFRNITTGTQGRLETLNAFMRSVYAWMSAGLGLTALAAYMVASSPSMMQLVMGNRILFFGLIIAEFALVFGISAGISKLSAEMASGLFLLYSVLNGVTLSVIFILYTQASIVMTFLICSGMFGAMSVYGMTTQKDLTSWGSFLFMGLIGIIIASIVNIFMKSSGLNFVISGIGVLLFTALTAYDTQKLTRMGESAPMNDNVALRRGSILGALTLYLDFINLFLMLLRFFGQTRD